MSAQTALPWPALVGLDQAQQALLLLAVEPRLQGVVLAAPAGSGKSSLVRGFEALWSALAARPAPFVEVPITADAESLLGGLDLDATLRSGQRKLRQGLLARANGGLLAVDGLHLLPDSTSNLLMAALDQGGVQLEREGVSSWITAQFCLIGCYDSNEGKPRRHLLDRVGLLAVLPAAADAEQRAAVVQHNLRALAAQWDTEIALLQGLIMAAREQLPTVVITPAQIEQLAATAVACGVEGQRVDLFAVRAACAAAALALRDTVEAEDLQCAAQLVIMPRATRLPVPPEPPADQPPAPPPEAASPPQASDDSADDPPPDAPDPEALAPGEQVLSALASSLPLDLANLPFRHVRRGRSGSRGTTAGKRGRHVRSTPGDPRQARLDLPATLRAATPWQRLRRGALTGNPRSPLVLQRDDLRVKHFEAKAGALFCFAVDASGSMAIHRMRQAKGAVQALLQQAYVHRDRVAVLAFRGSTAEVLLPPSQSVELARRALDLLPTGGGTPLAAVLLRAIEVAAQARSRGIAQTVLLLLTDGRANVGLRAQRDGVEQELQHLGRQVAAAGIHTLVIDTQRSYLGRGEARRLAEWLAGEYIYLPQASGDQIAALALAATG